MHGAPHLEANLKMPKPAPKTVFEALNLQFCPSGQAYIIQPPPRPPSNIRYSHCGVQSHIRKPDFWSGVEDGIAKAKEGMPLKIFYQRSCCASTVKALYPNLHTMP